MSPNLIVYLWLGGTVFGIAFITFLLMLIMGARK